MGDLDWIDIILHCVAATLISLAASAGVDSGVISFFLDLVVAVANVFFWPIRELYQHGWKWGGTQSTVEWVAPSVLSLPVFFI